MILIRCYYLVSLCLSVGTFNSTVKKFVKMTDKKAMNALFIMCTALMKEVAELRAEVKELRGSRMETLRKYWAS